MLHGRANIPSNSTVFTEGSTSIGGDVGDDLGARWSNGSAVEVVVAEEGCMGRKGGVDAR
jgi:hypothetical protein